MWRPRLLGTFMFHTPYEPKGRLERSDHLRLSCNTASCIDIVEVWEVWNWCCQDAMSIRRATSDIGALTDSLCELRAARQGDTPQGQSLAR